MIDIGFTGSRKGMTPEQQAALKVYFKHVEAVSPMVTFHHGDCLGSDEGAAQIANRIHEFTIYSHPPINETWRAFAPSDMSSLPKEYLVRDRDIVLASDVLVATPDTDDFKVGSGTWYTIRYAQRRQVPVWLIRSDGNATWA